MKGVTLDDLAYESRRMSVEAFVAQHPHPFLLVWENAPSEPEPLGYATVSSEAGSGYGDADDLASQRVFAVARPGDPNRFMITVGRTENNDVYLPHGKISKFHAYFQRDVSTGRWRVADAGSTNGTELRSMKLPANAPQEVADGDTLVFAGRYHATFYLPATLFTVMAPLM